MEVFKKINNNVALARDAKGRELVVFGKGIGFPSMPYELTDLSAVQRTFYDVNEKYFDLLREVPGEVFLVADDIADTAREELGCALSHNLTYALADHLYFAIQRCRDGITLQTPLAYDIRHLYPEEYSLARQALHQVRETLHVDLPEEESVSIALHFITAESEVGDMHSTILTAKVISEISGLVEQHLSVKLDKDSFSFSRFAMHLRYLVQRMMHGKHRWAEMTAWTPCSAPSARNIRTSTPVSSASTSSSPSPTDGPAAKRNSSISSCISTACAPSAPQKNKQNQARGSGSLPAHSLRGVTQLGKNTERQRPDCGLLRSGCFLLGIYPRPGARGQRLI